MRVMRGSVWSLRSTRSGQKKSTGLEKRRRLKDSGRSPDTYISRVTESQANTSVWGSLKLAPMTCGARAPSNQLAGWGAARHHCGAGHESRTTGNPNNLRQLKESSRQRPRSAMSRKTPGEVRALLSYPGQPSYSQPSSSSLPHFHDFRFASCVVCW